MNMPRKIPLLVVTALAAGWVPPASFGQVAKDGSDARLYDDLLDRLVGKWHVTAVVHGHNFTLDREAEWVLSHQYLRIREKSREVVPWLKIPFERTIYIGYNPRSKRYVVHELNVHGADVPFEPEGFSYATRAGNALEIVHRNRDDVFGIARWTWNPDATTWHFQGRMVIDGKEQEPHVDQLATAAKASAAHAESSK